MTTQWQEGFLFVPFPHPAAILPRCISSFLQSSVPCFLPSVVPSFLHSFVPSLLHSDSLISSVFPPCNALCPPFSHLASLPSSFLFGCHGQHERWTLVKASIRLLVLPKMMASELINAMHSRTVESLVSQGQRYLSSVPALKAPNSCNGLRTGRPHHMT